MPSVLPTFPNFLLALSLAIASHAADRWAPNAEAGAVDQLEIAGNACGPASLLTAIQCGNESWQALAARIPGDSDRSKLLYIIRAHGLRDSASLKGRKRWSGQGINSEDLTDIAGELAAIQRLPAPKSETLFLRKREKPAKLLRRAHDRLRDSLKRGLPPILTLKRYVHREGQWQPVQAHFVTVIRVPDKLKRGATSFSFAYFDPWRARKHEGTLQIPVEPVLSADGHSSICLETIVPQAHIGRRQLRAGESSRVVPVGVLGRL